MLTQPVPSSGDPIMGLHTETVSLRLSNKDIWNVATAMGALNGKEVAKTHKGPVHQT